MQEREGEIKKKRERQSVAAVLMQQTAIPPTVQRSRGSCAGSEVRRESKEPAECQWSWRIIPIENDRAGTGELHGWEHSLFPVSGRGIYSSVTREM